MKSRNAIARRALVTGGTGYIGSTLSAFLLDAGWDVAIVARRTSTTIAAHGSLETYSHDGTSEGLIDIVKSARPDVVFHLAASINAGDNPKEIDSLLASNIIFSTQLVEASVRNGVRYFVNTGTFWQHYHNKAYEPVNLYAATKQAFENLLYYYCSSAQIKAATLVLFDTYGPADPRKKILSLMWETALTQAPLALSPGEQYLDLVHVDDVVRAFEAVGEFLPQQRDCYARYGVSSGRRVRLMELGKIFQETTGYDLPIVWGGRPYREREIMVPWNEFSAVPGWRSLVPLEKGILDVRPR